MEKNTYGHYYSYIGYQKKHNAWASYFLCEPVKELRYGGDKKRMDFEVSENTDLVPYATLTMFNSTLEPIPDTHGKF